MSHPVALLLPGMSLNATIFPRLDIPTVAIDFTTLVLGPDGSSPELLARRMDLYADLLDRRLDNEPAWQASRRIVVAHSFGGMLAMAWWLARGGSGHARVDGLVLVATSNGPMYGSASVRIMRTGARDVRIGIERPMRTWNRPAITRVVKRLFTRGRLGAEPVDFQALASQSDWAMDAAGWRNTDWRSMRSFRLALEGFDVRERLRNIDVPAIVLHGDEDTVFPLDAARRLAAGLPRAELRVVPGAGHGLPLTHGGEILRAVHDLLGTHQPSSRPTV